MEFIKRHPYLFGALILVIILYFILRGRGASAQAQAQSATPGVSPQYQLAALQSSTQLEGAQIAATQRQNEINAQLAATQVTQATQLQEAQLARDVALQNIVTSGQVQTQTGNAQLEAIRAQVGGQVQVADIASQRDIQLAQISTQGQLGLAETAAKVQEGITQAQTQQAALAAETQQNITNQAAAVQLAQIGGQKDVQLAGIGAQTQIALGQQDVQKQYITTAAGVATNEVNQFVNLQENLTEQKYAAGSAYIPAVGGSQNRTAIIASIFGAPTVGVAAEQQTPPSTGQVIGGTFSNIFGGQGGGMLTALFG